MLGANVHSRCAARRRARPNLESIMKRLIFAALSAIAFATGASTAQAQVSAQGPFLTPAGELQFVRDDRDFVAMLDREIFDRFDGKTLTHFDEASGANGSISRVLVQSAAGPVLYDLRRRPVGVQHANTAMTIKRVFWQADEVVMQGSQGWYRFKDGKFTKLQSSTMTYH